MSTAKTPETTRDVVHTPYETGHLDQVAPVQPGGEDEDEDFSDDPEVIFRREYSKLDTIPLRQPVPLRVYVLFALMFASFLGGAVIGLVTYPSVTLTIVPVSRHVTYTGQLDVAMHQLAPVTITQNHTALTTGHGHQDASTASGMLTFYNGRFSLQTVGAGSVLTGSDGIQVVLDETLTIPAATIQQVGAASLPAHARQAGRQGNIHALDIDLAISSDLLAKNLSAFTGGQDARDFQAVARADLNILTSTLKNTLAQQIPQAFPLRSGETVYPTTCHFSITADHGVGEEATTLTVKATYTCEGIAYNSQELERRATAAFTSQTNPGAKYELVNTTAPQVMSLSPFTVRLSGTWVYVLSQDYEQFLAQQIAGESQEDARAYLLHTGFITQATVPAQLPKDPGHVHFLILVEG